MAVRAADALLAGLDERQRRAARHRNGPLAVIAGTGTGKTRVLVGRVAWLISSGHARPEEICALTVMNDSAREIAERLERMPEAEVAARITVGTSHRIANTYGVAPRALPLRALLDLGHRRAGHSGERSPTMDRPAQPRPG
jgi:hypothetical protein